MSFEITRVVHNICCSSAILANILLLAIIATKNPAKLRTMDTAEYMIQIITGPCQLTGSEYLSFLAFSFMMHGHAHYSILLAFGFCYRYYVIKYSSPRTSRLVLALFIAYVPTLIIYIFFANSPFLERSAMVAVMAVNYPSYDYEFRARTELVIGFERRDAIVYGTRWTQTNIMPVYVIVIVTTILINRLLATSLKMSEQSKKMHKEIMKGLLVQSLLPTLYFIAGGLHFARETRVIPDWEQAGYGAITVGSIVIGASPIITIHSIRPYRQIVVSLLNGRVAPSAATSQATQSNASNVRHVTVNPKEVTQL